MSIKYNKEIIIGFSKPRAKWKKPISQLIRFFEKSGYSHVYIKLVNKRLKNNFYYHASGMKINFMNESLFKQKNESIKEYKFTISEAKFYKTLDFAIGKVGQPYSFSQLLGFLIVKICGLFGKKITNPFGKKGYVCTELVAEILSDVYGKKILKDINLIGLKDIKNLIESYGTL